MQSPLVLRPLEAVDRGEGRQWGGHAVAVRAVRHADGIVAGLVRRSPGRSWPRLSGGPVTRGRAVSHRVFPGSKVLRSLSVSHPGSDGRVVLGPRPWEMCAMGDGWQVLWFPPASFLSLWLPGLPCLVHEQFLRPATAARTDG